MVTVSVGAPTTSFSSTFNSSLAFSTIPVSVAVLNPFMATVTE
jgi:hypothetical protein